MSSPKKNIVWLASYPKSGNTWVRIFLQHILGNAGGEDEIPLLREIPIASNRHLLDNYLGVNSSDLTEDEIKSVRPDVYKEISRRAETMQVLKVHDAFGYVSGNQLLFPAEITNAAIYIIRNPLDILISYAFHSNRTIDACIRSLNDSEFTISKGNQELKAQVPQHLGTWSDHVNSWINQSVMPVILIRYEDLLLNKDFIFKHLLDQLKIEYDHERFSRAIEKTDFDHLKQSEQEHGFREKPMQAPSFFRQGKSGIYKEYLTSQQIQQVVHMHESTMNKYGYNLL